MPRGIKGGQGEEGMPRGIKGGMRAWRQRAECSINHDRIPPRPLTSFPAASRRTSRCGPKVSKAFVSIAPGNRLSTATWYGANWPSGCAGARGGR